MSDPLADLSELADTVERGVSDGSLDSERAVQLRAVEPLLEILGWDVRGPEVVPEGELSGLTVDYLLLIESQPAVAVRTVPPGTDPMDSILPELESGLATVDVDRGMVADGRTIHLVLRDGENVHSRSIPFSALAEHADALGRFHRSMLVEAVTHSRSDRRQAALHLDENRDALLDAVTTEILSVTGEEYEDAVSEEATHMIDALHERLDPEPVEQHEPSGQEAVVDAREDAPDASRFDDRDDADREADATNGGAATPAHGGNGGESPRESSERSGASAAESDDEPDEQSHDREYVVRFFGGPSSVGAVGTDSPTGTVVGAVRYLLENHDLQASLTLPWQTTSGATVLATTAASPDWTTLANEDGTAFAVRPIDDPALAKETIEELADAAGLRVMYQGDW